MNLKFNKQLSAFTAIAVMVIAGCKTPSNLIQREPLELPTVFEAASDTQHAALSGMNWKQFFTDDVLIALIDTALHQNLDLNSALHRIEMSRARVLQQKGLMLPSLEGIVNGGIDNFGKYTMTGVGNFDTNLSPNITDNQKVGQPIVQEFYLGLRSSWEIDIWGKLRDRKQAAAFELLASERGRQWLITQLVAQVAMLYYDLRTLDDRLEVIQRNIGLQERALEIVEAQKEGGRATSLAVQQFTAQVLNSEGLKEETLLAIERIKNEMNVLMGRFAGAEIPRGLPILEQRLPEQIGIGVPADMIERRPDIQEAYATLEASKANVSAARKAFLPSLNINAYMAFNAFKLPLLFSSGSLAYGLLGGVVQPIFNRYQLKSQFNITTSEQQIAFNDYELSILKGFREVQDNLKGLEHYRKIVDLSNQEVAVLRDAVVTSNDLYLNGRATYIEIVMAQAGVLDAELKRTAFQKQLMLSVLDLYRSLGGGWQ